MVIHMLYSKNSSAFIRNTITGLLFFTLASAAFSANDDILFARIVCKDSSEYYLGESTYDYPIDGTQSMVKGLQNALFSKGKKYYENECHPDKYYSVNDAEEYGVYHTEEIHSKTVIKQTNKFILYSNFSYIYDGGAHGFGGFTYEIYTKPYGHVFKINQSDYKNPQKIRSILWNNLTRDIEQEGFNELQHFGTTEDSLRITENIYYEKDSLSFEYTVYEIAPYAWGQIQIKVPYETILGNLKPEKARILKEIQESFK